MVKVVVNGDGANDRSVRGERFPIEVSNVKLFRGCGTEGDVQCQPFLNRRL